VVNSPCNPTGVLYPNSVLEALAELAEKHDLLVISDDIYDKLIYEGARFTPFASLPGMKDRTVMVNGVSKTYAMTGFRIGYLASTKVELVKAASNIQGQSTSNPTSIAQAAAIEALTGPQDEVGRMREIFEKRRNLMVDGIGKIDGLSVVKPEGAFYAFVNIRSLYRSGKVSTTSDVARFLLETQHVACVPGSPFGSEDHVRFSFATNDETIRNGLERVEKACRELA
jgi:aspartate aminotransferase